MSFSHQGNWSFKMMHDGWGEVAVLLGLGGAH
jgi:hypothetical protein